MFHSSYFILLPRVVPFGVPVTECAGNGRARDTHTAGMLRIAASAAASLDNGETPVRPYSLSVATRAVFRTRVVV